MATAEQIADVRLNIDDQDSTEFTDPEIAAKIDVHDSVNWASWKLLCIMITRLSTRKDLKEDQTASEKTIFHSIEEQRKVLESSKKEFENAYNSEIGNSAGRYLKTKDPCIGVV